MVVPTVYVLDENTANKIAAGEVVERPAAVVKELVENAIDAGSQRIEIEIAEGGIQFIRVTDDGVGMNRADAELALLRHATSKIRSADDLAQISSLGFRGEALPSIAAVAKFTINTRVQDAEFATYIAINGGSQQEIREAGGSIGTTVTVAELFYNTPARRKFLKTATAEANHISEIVSKLALAYPHIAFRLLNNSRLTMSTSGNGSLKDVLASLYGNKILPDLLPVTYIGELINVSGYVAKPSLLKSNRHWQTFMVNARIVDSRMLYKALDNAYHSLLPKAGYPLAVVQIVLPSDTIDVNVHPQKHEVKFSDEQHVFRAVHRAVTQTLAAVDESNFAATPERLYSGYRLASQTTANSSINESSTTMPYSFAKQEVEQVQLPGVRETRQDDLFLTEKNQQQDNTDKGTLATQSANEVSEPVINTAKVNWNKEQERQSQHIWEPLGQIAECYIVAAGDDGLYIIDQHAAHERILFDRLSHASERIPAQQLLIPLLLDVDQAEYSLIEENNEVFQQLGFSLEPIGPATMRLLEMPADIPHSEAENVLRQILALLPQGVTEKALPSLRQSAMQFAACRGAIKAGEILNLRQMRALLAELANTEYPYTCPHGRPTTIRLSAGDLAKMFKRT